jgi:hypothetical protein
VRHPKDLTPASSLDIECTCLIEVIEFGLQAVFVPIAEIERVGEGDYGAFQDAEKLVPQLSDEYNQIYYEGIVNERWASTQLERGTASKSLASWIGRAMRCYERAEELSDGKNPDPILRWNTCVRLQEQIGSSEPVQAPLRRDLHSEYGDDVPPR